MRYFIFIITLVWLTPAMAKPTIVVDKKAVVAGPTIELGEIARFGGFSKARTAELAAIEVGKSPGVGLGQYMPRAYLRERIRGGGVPESVMLKLPLRLELSRREKLIKAEYIESRVRAALDEALPHAPEEVAEIRVPHIADIRAPAGADLSVHFRAKEDFSGPVVANVIVSDSGEKVRSRRVSLFVDLFVETYSVSEDLRRGHRISLADLVSLRIPQSRLPKDAIARPEFAEGALVRRTIRSGEPIRDAFLEVPPMVKRGQRVRMVARRGSVSISSLGEALGNGALGSMIRVRNLTSRKIVGGEVIRPGVVEMEF